MTSRVVWQIVRRGLHLGRVDGTLVAYVSRTRYGWAYGRVNARGDYVEADETTRPIARAKVLAERAYLAAPERKAEAIALERAAIAELERDADVAWRARDYALARKRRAALDEARTYLAELER